MVGKVMVGRVMVRRVMMERVTVRKLVLNYYKCYLNECYCDVFILHVPTRWCLREKRVWTMAALEKSTSCYSSRNCSIQCLVCSIKMRSLTLYGLETR